MAFMGHGVKLLDMTFSDSAPESSAPDAENETKPANPDSGVEGVAVIVGAAAMALGAMIVTKKRNK